MATHHKWKVGDLFFRPQWPNVIYRVHRRHGSTIYYLRSHYGSNPPRGIIQNAHTRDAELWEPFMEKPRNATNYQFTNEGRRSKTRGECEKCNTPTNWIVMIFGRPIYWCGCD